SGRYVVVLEHHVASPAGKPTLRARTSGAVFAGGKAKNGTSETRVHSTSSWGALGKAVLRALWWVYTGEDTVAELLEERERQAEVQKDAEEHAQIKKGSSAGSGPDKEGSPAPDDLGEWGICTPGDDAIEDAKRLSELREELWALQKEIRTLQ